MNPVAASFMPSAAIDPRQQQPPVEQQQQQEEGGGLDVGIEPGAELGYPGLDGDMRIISREIYQGKTFEDWDDMEGIVRRLARKAGFKVVKVRKGGRKRKRMMYAFSRPHVGGGDHNREFACAPGLDSQRGLSRAAAETFLPSVKVCKVFCEKRRRQQC